LNYLLGAGFLIAGVCCLVFLDKVAAFTAAWMRMPGLTRPFMSEWQGASGNAVSLMFAGVGFLIAAMRPVAPQSTATSFGALLAVVFGLALSSAVIWVVSRKTWDAGSTRDLLTSAYEWVAGTVYAAVALMCISLVIASRLAGFRLEPGDVSASVVSGAFFIAAGATIFMSAGLFVRPTLLPGRPAIGLISRILALALGLFWVAFGAAHL